MFGRVSRYHGEPGRTEEAFAAPSSRELQEAPGFLGAYALVDHKTGNAMTITLWETEEAMLDSVELADRLRQQISDDVGGTEPPTYEMYEVVSQPEVVPIPERR